MMKRHVAIVGSGPAGLMAASALAAHGLLVTVFEKKRGPAAKLLIAGRSGLNVSNACKVRPLLDFYEGPRTVFENIFKMFSVQDWLQFIENLGIKTFEGTSQRYFIHGLKTPPLLKAWLKDLQAQGVKFAYGMELSDFSVSESPKRVKLIFNENEIHEFDAVCLCLGGGSWRGCENKNSLEIFAKKEILCAKFTAANVGQDVAWSVAFLAEAEGLPLKNITVTSSQGTEPGEITITRYGVEGTPIYNLKNSETIFLDLKPDLTAAEILLKLSNTKENLSPLRRIKKLLNLCEAADALLFHFALPKTATLGDWVAHLKKFPLTLFKKRGLPEAISSTGGVSFEAVDENLMLKKFPGIFVAGEILDWNAPTGGFLIQGCVSQGFTAGQGILKQTPPTPSLQEGVIKKVAPLHKRG